MDSSLNDKIFLNIFKKREMRRTKNVKEKEERKTLLRQVLRIYVKIKK